MWICWNRTGKEGFFFFFFLIGVFCKERHLMDLILHMEEAAPFLFVVLFYFELMRIFVS